MKGIRKQEAGFRFGVHPLEILQELGRVAHLGRTYKVVLVRTEAGQEYVAIRLYNEKGKFIKQFLLEPEIAFEVGRLLKKPIIREL